MRRVGGSAIRKNILVDVSNITHRAFYNIRSKKPNVPIEESSFEVSVKTIEILNQILRDLVPFDQITIFFDGKSKKRLAAFPEYKAQRKKEKILGSVWNKEVIDGTFINTELDFLIHCFKLLGCDILHLSEHEADDGIASFIASNSEEFNVVVSDDKDFFQLLTYPRTVIFRPSDKKVYDFEESTNYWTRLNNGSHPAVRPDQLRLFKSLCGDSSDNIKGVFRLTKKSAISVCVTNDIDDFFSMRVLGLSDTDRNKVLDAEDTVRLNYEIVGLNSTIDIKESIVKGSKNLGIFRSIMENLGVNISISQFCDIEVMEKKPILPDWYKELD
jgi:5'-3' exonuclease